MIPFLDLKAAYQELREEMDLAYQRVMDSGRYIMGAETEAFEAEFAAYVGIRHCITVGNGLDALKISLEAHGIGPGDEVIVPAHTFIATWLAVSHCGAVPVGVDVCRDTANMDASLLERVVTKKTKAVIPVHLYGQSAEMDPILNFAARHGLVVIEDAAQAHGARYKGRMCGSLGHSAAFSFYPGKNLGAFSDGGAITTNDDEVARKARMLRNYGSEKRYHYDIAGMNSRLDELQAAFLRIRLRRLDEWNARRAAAAEQYRQLLSKLSAPLVLPFVPEWAASVWHLFVIRHPMRDHFRKHLIEHGIHTNIHYPIPPHLSQAYQPSAGSGFPVTEELCGEILSLPMGPHLSSEQIEECTAQIAAFLESHQSSTGSAGPGNSS